MAEDDLQKEGDAAIMLLAGLHGFTGDALHSVLIDRLEAA
jgi:hypothetical protein